MITANRSALHRGLKIASQCAATKPTVPILSSVMLRATGAAGLTISATNLVVGLSAKVSSFNVGSDKGVAVNAAHLAELVANAPGDEISLSVADSFHVEIKSGKVKYRLAGVSDRDFPAMPAPNGAAWVSFESAVLSEMISRTVFACSSDEIRHHLSGVCVAAADGRVTMSATDGHRVCQASRPSVGLSDRPVIVPAAGCEMIRNLAAQGPLCTLAVVGGHVFVKQDDAVVSVKLIDAVFPDMEQIFRLPTTKTLTVGRLMLLQAMKRAKLMTTDLVPIKLSCGEFGVSVTTINPDMGEVVESLDGTFTGGEFAIGLNPKYVIEMVSTMTSDEVRMDFGDALSPVTVRPAVGDDFRGVVLPMRIS